MAIAFAINDGDTDVTLGTSADLTHLDGANASEFAVVGAGDWCYSPQYYYLSGPMCCPGLTLVPHAWCELPFEFRPTSVGSKQASYVVGGGAGTLTLSGASITAPGTFHADTSSLAYSYVTVIQSRLGIPVPPTVAFRLINDSAQTVNVGTLSIDPMYTASDDCPPSLTPGGACNASVSMVLQGNGPPQIADCRSTQLTSSTSMLAVPVTYAPPPAPFPTSMGVALIGDGTGGGEVVSSPAGIDCTISGSGCAMTSWAPLSSIELTETTAAGSEFIGWLRPGDSLFLPCGRNQSCTLSAPAPSLFQPTSNSIEAWFALSSDKHVNVTIVGAGVIAAPGLATCTSSCTFAVPPGGSFNLTAATSGTFVGWSGDCSGTGTCQLGAIVNDRNVTATFSP